MNLHLDPELEQIVRQRMQTGHYHSATDVIGEALHLLEERDQILAFRREGVQRRILDGLESLRLGKDVDGEAVFDRIESELDTMNITVGIEAIPTVAGGGQRSRSVVYDATTVPYRSFRVLHGNRNLERLLDK